MPSLGGLGKLLSSSSSKSNIAQDGSARKTRGRASSDRHARNRSLSSGPSTPPGAERSISDSYFSPPRRRTPRAETSFDTDDYGFPVNTVDLFQGNLDYEKPLPNRPMIKGRCRICSKSYQASAMSISKCDACAAMNGQSSSSSRVDLDRDARPFSTTRTQEILEGVIEESLKKLKQGRAERVTGTDSGNKSGHLHDYLTLPPVMMQPTKRRGSAPDSAGPTPPNGLFSSPVPQFIKRKSPGRLNLEDNVRPKMPPSPNLSPALRPSENGLPFPEPLLPNWNLEALAPKSADVTPRPTRGPSTRHPFRPILDHITEVFRRSNMNVSFSTINHQKHGKSVEMHRGAAKKAQEKGPAPPPKIFPMDHKNLMVGDVYDVASSLISEQSSPVKRANSSVNSQKPKLVDYGSPHIDWRHVRAWFDMVLGASVGSHTERGVELQGVNAEAVEDDEKAVIMDMLSQTIRNKILELAEHLLVCPQKTPSEPRDLRYLLILLANPLLVSSKEYPVRYRSRRTRSVTVPTRDHPSNSRHLSPRRMQKRSAAPPIQARVLSLTLGTLANLPVECHNHMIQWLSKYPEDLFRKQVDMLVSFIDNRISVASSFSEESSQSAKPKSYNGVPTSHIFKEYLHSDMISDEPPQDWQLRSACKVLQTFVRANDIFQVKGTARPNGSNLARRRHVVKQLLPSEYFYNYQLDLKEKYHARQDFDDWEKKRPGLQLSQFPFLLSLGRKIEILEFDAKRKMNSKARQDFFESILRNTNGPDRYFHLTVRRSCIIEDSLLRISQAINSSEEEAKKALKLHFEGEEGIDAGGLRKEWFMLLVRELFEPGVGLFVYNEETNYCYFNPNSLESSEQFQLVGAVLGLAIYNFIILDVPFPPFLFRKLAAAAPPNMGAELHQGWRPAPVWRPELNDLAQFDPSLARNLRYILDYEGSIADDIGTTFQVDTDQFGKISTVSLLPGGENRPVTEKNREEYVDLYVDNVLDKSVRKQFEPFARGFYNVCGGNALSLFRGEEIELLIRGSGELDLKDLRSSATYENWKRPGPSDVAEEVSKPDEVEAAFPVVAWFWELMALSSADDRRRVLRWVTGSDRVPAAGTAGLGLCIQCLGEDCGRLPQARTCFNVLQLWNYGSRAAFVKKFWYAVVESEGFGLQ